MSSLVSNSKKLHGSEANGVDRLSSLPDPLLHLVMSFLPVPEVVRTCLLSPRWRDLWASAPFIHLDYNDFVDGEDDREKRMTDENGQQKFGDQLLLLRDGTLPLDEARILFRGARLLHVHGSSDIRIIFDNSSLFSSQHLRRIKLQEARLDDRFFRPLNLDFHVLEHLELEHCNVWDPQQVSSWLLKTIRISCCHFSQGLEICAPNLNHLSILDPTFRYSNGCFLVTRDLHSLVTTSISLRSGVLQRSRGQILDYSILHGLSHVTALELYAPLSEHAFERGLQTCPVFGNLTSLVLDEWCMACDFTPLLLILRRSPRLKDLTFKLKMEQCGTWKDVELHLSARKESSPENYPSIERTVIYCGKDDPRVSALVQVLLPIVIPCGEISIKGH
ncbi:hypothetical protein VPH35_056809 [Triticum aestivum]